MARAAKIKQKSNKPIVIKKANRGKFTAKAKAAGTSTQAYANKVLKKGSKASKSTKKQANFARNFGGKKK